MGMEESSSAAITAHPPKIYTGLGLDVKSRVVVILS